jgi:hypothetical protein
MFLPIYRNDGALERGVSQATLLPSNVTSCDGERPPYRKDRSTTAEIEISSVMGGIRVFAQRGSLRCDTDCQPRASFWRPNAPFCQATQRNRLAPPATSQRGLIRATSTLTRVLH